LADVEGPQTRTRDHRSAATTNLVFAQTRTSDHPKSATVEVSYTAGGTSYTLTEVTRVLVAVKC
jgi:hypothetical protein